MAQRKIILAFTGHVASGKGTACEYFVKKHGARIFRFSTMLRDILDRLYLPHDRDHLQTLSTIVREYFGQDAMARVIARDVEAAEESLIVVDGARRLEDVIYLRRLPGFKLISVEASPKVRFKRLTGRGENPDDASKTWAEFQQEEQAESEAMIPALMAEADSTINNDGDVASLERQLENLYRKINEG